jgi:uncharacterized protein (DUF488 family)
MENTSHQPAESGAAILSVGHSNHELERFVELLRQARVSAIADVRSSPFSRRLPQFNRPHLESALRQHQIAYVFLGDLLGGRPAGPELYTAEGWVDYERVRATAPFQRGLDRLIAGQQRFTIAMMCGEEDPLDCHRGLMITPALTERGIVPGHLRKDGSIETTTKMERRLCAETRVGAGLLDGLFPLSAEERRLLLADAYRVMNRKKGYRLEEQ